MIVRKFSRVTPSEASSSGTEWRQEHVGHRSHHLRRLSGFILLHSSRCGMQNGAVGSNIGGVHLSLRSFITGLRGRCSRTAVTYARVRARLRTHARTGACARARAFTHASHVEGSKCAGSHAASAHTRAGAHAHTAHIEEGKLIPCRVPLRVASP